MNYLYLDFSFNLTNGGKNWDDYFSTSLLEQYSNIYKKVGNSVKPTIEDFSKFINICFNPMENKTYYLSMPAFNREPEEDRKGNILYRNIVIRPEKTSLMEEFIPNGHDVILIGDVKNFGAENFGAKMFVVKGIETINQVKKNKEEISITANSKNAFDQTEIKHWMGETYNSYYDDVNCAITNNLILKLVNGPYYVNDINFVEKKYRDWKDYIAFRKYYLEEQSKQAIKFSNCEILNTYVIPKQVYRLNEDKLKDMLLDEHFARDEQVVLIKNIDNSESFPLIKISVDYNKKLIYDNLSERLKKPKEELFLNRFTRQDISLTSLKPTDKNANRNQTIQLDERYRIYGEDVLPDTSDIEINYKQREEKFISYINNEYKEKILKEIDPIVEDENNRLTEYYINKFNDFDEELQYKYQIEIKKEKKQDRIDKITRKYEKLSDEENERESVEKERKLKSFKLEQFTLLENKYKTEINLKILELQNNLKTEKNKEIEEKIENETIRRFCIYFKVEKDYLDEYKKEIDKIKPCYMVYNNIAEKTKIDRQEKSLEAFFKGFVKNPYLSKYLFEPKSLKDFVIENNEELDWNLQSLNEKQKEAVRKAVASESLFLLQGPPGTGKTQVIAEIIAQLTKRGKKILVSSETHKAIDNVFDRLPKIPEIRPLRLIPNVNGKTSDYNPEKLVDNFYINITQKIDNQIKSFENFTNTKQNFGEEYDNLKLDYQRVLKTESNINKLKLDIQTNENDKKDKNENISQLRNELDYWTNSYNDYEYLIKRISSFNINIDTDNTFKETFVTELNNEINNILKQKNIFKNSNISNIMTIDMTLVKDELERLVISPELIELENKKAQIKTKIQNCLDDDTMEVLEGYEDQVKILRTEFSELRELIKKEKSKSVSYDDFTLSNIIELNQLTDEDKENLPNDLMFVKSSIMSVINKNLDILKEEEKPLIDKINEIEEKISAIKLDIMQIDENLTELRENNNYINYNDLVSSLKQKINKFFNDFNIVKDYKDIPEALKIIKSEWKELEENFDKKEQENKTLIPMYRKICKFLRKEDVIENDRIFYTKQLFDNANVFGITCTSRDRFRERDLESLSKYNLGDLDVRTQGIDVVIIDEVSKSSFLDLLIPILYGKTVILVGDHRQLPPMYDLRNLKQSDISDLDEDIININKNKYYTELYEECFFKTLYEQVPETNKIMLNQQYRCHEDIMRVFNHFYGGKDNKGLMLGYKKQNDEKQHYLNININGKNIIEQDKHIYFINCDKHDFNDNGSTSIQNPQEADVVCSLLKSINSEYDLMIKNNKLNVLIDKERNIDKRPSIGVICTYGDQAGLIKRKLKGIKEKFTSFSKNNDEKLIISTVDDFQGDERDIIILSMVRNPVKRLGNYDFIKKFERINVALSRARKLLIVVGNKDFLSNCGVINLPDIDGNKALDRQAYPVYKEIINTIEVYGKILQSDDILGKEE